MPDSTSQVHSTGVGSSPTLAAIHSIETHYMGRTWYLLELGSGGNDVLDGGNISTAFRGEGGHDQIRWPASGSNYADLVFAGAGRDTIHAGDGKDIVFGEDGNDLIHVEGDADIFAPLSGWEKLIQGDAGNDTIVLDSSTGRHFNQVLGGDGDDLFLVTVPGLNGSADVEGNLRGGDGFDRLRLEGGGHVTFRIEGLTEFERIEFSPAGVPGEQRLTLVRAALDGPVEVRGRDENGAREVLTLETRGDTDISGWTFTRWGGQDELVVLSDSNGGHQLIGSAVSDLIQGNGGDDTIRGGGRSDTLEGGDGADQLFGQNGRDLLSGDAGRDTLVGGAGADTLEGGADDDQLDGDGGNDLLHGQSGADLLRGGAGNDTLQGGAGNDTLMGGGGTDQLFGGAGDDVLEVVGAGGLGAAAVLDGGGGTDRLRVGGASLVDLRGATIAGIEILAFGGNAGNPVTVHLAASQLGGGALFPALSIEGNAQGPDLLQVSLGTASSASLALWQFTGWSATLDLVTVRGGASNDTITGSSQRDVLRGAAGADVIGGGSGADTLLGEGGDDVLTGGDGNDSLAGGGRRDILNGGPGDDTMAGGAGNDTLVMGPGADRMLGNGGDDSFMFGGIFGPAPGALPAQAVLDGGLGTDRIVIGGNAALTDLSAATIRSIEQVVFDGFGFDPASRELRLDAGQLGGGALAQGLHVRGDDRPGAVETIAIALSGPGGLSLAQWTFADWGGQGDRIAVSGSAGVDKIVGSAVADESEGRAPNDSLDGGGGDDTLDGGSGDDQLTGGQGSDVLAGGNGRDLLLGGPGDDVLSGGDGPDTLDGGAGRDTLTGGAGTDIFVFSAALHSGPGDGARDEIADFNPGEDRVDLTGLGGLTYIRADPFSGKGGEVRFDPLSGLLQADPPGDGKASFEVLLVGVRELELGNLIL